MSGTSSTARGSGDLANVQSEPGLSTSRGVGARRSSALHPEAAIELILARRAATDPLPTVGLDTIYKKCDSQSGQYHPTDSHVVLHTGKVLQLEVSTCDGNIDVIEVNEP